MTGEEPAYDARSEVRFAVVLYGGVSLAIYMNGIVQELYELVRATAPKPALDRDALTDAGIGDRDRLALDDDELTGSGRVYRELGRRLRLGSAVEPAADGAVTTRFVVDIITGTSAGGINGVFLAKALANDQSIAALGDLWVSEGDIDRLLNDDRSAKGLRLPPNTNSPESLLSGDRMLYLLLDAIDTVSASNDEPPRSPYADEIDLWITTTDLEGCPEQIGLTRRPGSGPVTEADHRMTFHFMYDSRPASSQPLNLFSSGYDPMLAFAARCTSSFPGAFQPVQLDDLQPVIDGIRSDSTTWRNGRERPEWYGLDSDEIGTFFTRYGLANRAAWKTVSFADGGYLNNRPVDLVMETLPKRRASLPVARRVLIVEPDPGEPLREIADLARPRTGLISTVLKVISLPRKQTIGGVVERILALRGPLRTRNQIYDAVDQHLARTEHDASTAAGAGYRAFRLAQVAEDVGGGIARVGFPLRLYAPDSEQRRAADQLVGCWLTGLDDAERQSYVDRLDLAYQLRTINFVQGRAGRLMRDDPENFSDLRRARRDLDGVYTMLAHRGRELRFRREDDADLTALRSMMGEVPLDTDREGLDAWLDGGDRRATLGGALDYFARELDLGSVDRSIRAALVGCDDLLELANRFDAYDEATYALNAFVPGENDDIEIVRVSPRDASNIRADSSSDPKLAGAAVHHFGAFFSADWRRNDILWGRLDGAEQIITSLWPADADDELRRDLVTRAQQAILVDALRDEEYRSMLGRCFPGGTAPDAPATDHERAEEASLVFEALGSVAPPAGPKAEVTLGTAGRAARIADRIGSGLGYREGPAATVSRWLGRGLRLGAGLIDLALPGKVRSLIGRHLLDVAIVAAVLMILLGGIVGGPSVSGFGWTVLFVVLAVKIVLEVMDHWLDHPARFVATAIVAAVLVGFAVYGAVAGDGWAQVVVLLLNGVAIGLVFATATAGSWSWKRVPLVALALLLVLVCAVIGIDEMRGDVTRSLCEDHHDAWYTDVVTAVLVDSCDAT